MSYKTLGRINLACAVIDLVAYNVVGDTYFLLMFPVSILAAAFCYYSIQKEE